MENSLIKLVILILLTGLVIITLTTAAYLWIQSDSITNYRKYYYTLYIVSLILVCTILAILSLL